MKTEPTFWVRDIPVYGDVILAPMAGYSDVPYRALCRAYGSAMNYTEFIPAETLLVQPNAMWRRLDIKKGEHPIVFQIFGNNAQTLLQAAQRIEAWGPDIVDINMGCSVYKISGRGAGVGMMPQPKLIADTFRLLSRHLTIPVTGKLRIGWDDNQRNFLEIARIMEDNGAALIALHGRTRTQKYNVPANWDVIGELKQAVNVPVIGNGDVGCAADIDTMKAQTGCDAVMVGRAAIGNPWIFSRREHIDLTLSEISATIRLHLHEMLDYYGDPKGLYLFRKHARRYYKGLPVKPYLQKMISTDDVAEFLGLVNKVEQELQIHTPQI